MSRSPARPYLWMLAGAVCFAVMSSLAHEAGERCNWQTVAFFRAFLVLVFVGLFCRVSGTPVPLLRPRRLWVRSLAGSFSLTCAFYALARLPASTVVTLSNTFPIWVAVLSWPVLRVLPSARVWVAVAGGVAGVYLIQQPSVGADDLAIGLALLSAVFTSVAMIGLHKLRSVNTNAIVVHFSFVATICSGLAFFVFDRKESPLPFYHPEAALLLLGVGVMASIGQVCLTRAFTGGDPSKVSVVGLAQVVFALLIDVAISGHEISSIVLIGTGLILAPTAWVMTERKRPKGTRLKEPMRHREPETSIAS